MRLLPRSLFGRLVLVLFGGLVVAQLLSAAINYAERTQQLMHASGVQSAQRVADAAKLLDSLEPGERRRVAAILSVPPQIVTLDRPPAVVEEEAGNEPRLAMFREAVRSALGDGREIRVSMREASAASQLAFEHRRREMMERHGPAGGPGMGGPGARGPMMRGVFFLTQVRLSDASWVTFDTLLPEDSAPASWKLPATLAILLAAVLAVSIVAVRWVTRPLKALATAAEELGRNIHRPPLPEAGPTEVRDAATAFNRMQARLARFLDERSRVLAAMSHDLKTPITRMRLRSELLDDAALRAQFEKDLAEMEAMVTDTLAFMRGLESTEAPRPIDMMALLESLQDDNEAMGREVRIEGRATAPVPGVAQLLRRCLSNLVDNAVIYGERALILVEEEPAELRIRVRDTGPGLPEAELERVFEPFYRLEASRSRETGGTGLGLGIARNIARSHGGDVRLANHPGGGLEAILTLPRS
jgi:signal transduction histidine kinase